MAIAYYIPSQLKFRSGNSTNNNNNNNINNNNNGANTNNNHNNIQQQNNNNNNSNNMTTTTAGNMSNNNNNNNSVPATSNCFRANITVPLTAPISNGATPTCQSNGGEGQQSQSPSQSQHSHNNVGCWELLTQIFCNVLRSYHESHRQPAVIQISIEIANTDQLNLAARPVGRTMTTPAATLNNYPLMTTTITTTTSSISTSTAQANTTTTTSATAATNDSPAPKAEN